MNDNVFIKSVDSATSEDFVDNFSATSDAPIPADFNIDNLETSISELTENIQNALSADLNLPQELENKLKQLLTENKQTGGGKKYKITEGAAKGKNKRGVKMYVTENSPGSDRVDPLKPHREFVAHIQNAMKLKGGPALQVFAKMYKDEAKEKFPNKSSIEQTEEAKRIFDKDSNENRLKKYQKAVDKVSSKKSKKD